MGATVSWVGGSGDWNTTTNWSTGALPEPADDVVINVPGDITVTHFSGTHAVLSIQCQEAFVLSGGSLSVSNTSRFSTNFTLSGGTLAGSGDVTVTGTMNWVNGGTMAGNGRTIIAAGAMLNVSHNAGYPTLSRVLENAGTLNWSGSPYGWNFAGGTLNNLADGVVNASAGYPINNSGGANAINNAGTWNKIGSSSTAIFVAFDNSGIVQIAEGILRLAASGIDFPGATFFESGISGTLQLSAGGLTGSATNAAQYAPTGRLLFDGGGPRQLEVMSRDVGKLSDGYTHNFAYGTIELAPGANVTLVNNADNSPGPEALYVESLIVRSGATFNLSGLKVYTRAAAIDGAVTGGTISLTPKDPDLRYGTGFVWRRFADYRAGVTDGSIFGNPNPDQFGTPTWRYSWVDQNNAAVQVPWYATPPTAMVWSAAWFGRPELARWQRGANISPVIDRSFLLQGNVFDSQQAYAPLAEWRNPTGRDIAVDVSGPASVRWFFRPSPGRIEVVIAKRSGRAGGNALLFQQNFDKPAPDNSDESIAFQVDLRNIAIGPSDELVFAMRKIDDLAPDENTIFYDEDISITLRTPVSWTGAGDGSSWLDPLNWSSNAVPSVTDNVVISLPPNTPINIAGPQAVQSVLSEAPLTLLPASSLVVGGSAFAKQPVTVNGILQGGSWTFISNVLVNGNGLLATSGSDTTIFRASLLGDTTNSAFSFQGIVQFNGIGTPAAPQRLEVMGRDLGNVVSGLQLNFAYGTLALDNNTTVKLVDESANSPGAGPEALYTSKLVVPAGTTLDLNGLVVYARAAQTDGAIVGGTVMMIPDAGPIDFAVPTPGAISSPLELDEWTFFGRSGNSVAVQIEMGSEAVLPPQLSHAELRVVDPALNLLARASNVVARQTVVLTNVQLPSNGVYRIQVRPPANQPSATGNYLLTLWDATPEVRPLILNQTLYGRTETPYSADRWTFSATAGQQVRLDFINSSAAGLDFTLRGPGGWIGFSNLLDDSGLVTLPADGAYALTVQGTGGSHDIAYAFKLIETAQTPLALGETFTGQFTGSGQAQIFIVTVTNSGPLRITLTSGVAGSRTELYLARREPPTRGIFDFTSTSSPGANQDLLIPNVPVGTF